MSGDCTVKSAAAAVTKKNEQAKLCCIPDRRKCPRGNECCKSTDGAHTQHVLVGLPLYFASYHSFCSRESIIARKTDLAKFPGSSSQSTTHRLTDRPHFFPLTIRASAFQSTDSSSGNIIKMKFAIVSILLYVFAENHLSVSARSPRKLSKGSKKVKNYNYETNPVSTQHKVITISHVPTDPEPIVNRNDNQGDPVPVPVVQCEECTDEGEFYSNVTYLSKCSNFLFRVSH